MIEIKNKKIFNFFYVKRLAVTQKKKAKGQNMIQTLDTVTKEINLVKKCQNRICFLL